MDAKDWILLFVTVFVGALFSVIISNVCIYFSNNKKKKQNILIRRLELTFPYIEAIRMPIMQFDMDHESNDFLEIIKALLMAGDYLKVYLRDNKSSMEKEQSFYKKDYLHLNLIEEIANEVYLTATYIKGDENEFAKHYRKVEKLCNEVLMLYNTSLVELK